MDADNHIHHIHYDHIHYHHICYCAACARDQPFEQPPCADGHGDDCPERACVVCGHAVLVDPLLVDPLLVNPLPVDPLPVDPTPVAAGRYDAHIPYELNSPVHSSDDAHRSHDFRVVA